MKRFLYLNALFFLAIAPVNAWNALGHKVVCEIAWNEISPEKREEIVSIIRRHPRFDEDFAKKDMPIKEQERWIFWHAGTWPDIARGIKGEDRKNYNNPTWHYVNFPVFLGPERSVTVNLATHPAGARETWNVAQATRFCLGIIHDQDRTYPLQYKALAYSWLFHLVGDMHQPLHTSALFSDRFPKGDRGGNSVKVKQGGNLHSFWDNLLGRQHEYSDVLREVYDLRQREELWNVDTTGTIDDWIAESHERCKSYVYSTHIRLELQQTGAIQPIVLSNLYLAEAGDHARSQIVAAGLRLGVLLGANPREKEAAEVPRVVTTPSRPPNSLAPPRVSTKIETPTKDFWLNTNTGVRHRRGCRWYGDTSKGRACTASEGKPCKVCGG